MQTGVVKWYDSVKGYGFILSDDGKDIFVHRTGLKNLQKLEPGQKVKFEVSDGNKGPAAVNVE